MFLGIINVLIFISVLYGLFLIFDINFYSLSNQGLDYLMDDKKLSIRKQNQILKGKTKDNFIKQEVKKLNYILEITDKKKYLPLVFALSCGLSLGGIILAIFIKNPYLMPVLAIGFFLIPFWIMEDRITIYKEELGGHIQTALSIITTSYLRTENIILSVQENIEFIDDSLRPYFKEFLVDTNINPNIEVALIKLKNKVDNKFFKEYVDNMIACQSNQTLKSTLPAITRKMSDLREINVELNAMFEEPKRNFLTMFAIIFGGYLAVGFTNKDFILNLFQTEVGKICFAIAVAIMVFSIHKVIKLIKPLEE